MTRIASRVSQLNGEGALAVYSRAKELERQGRSIIHLELGEPEFSRRRPGRRRAAQRRCRRAATVTASTRGLLVLREAIAEYLKRTRRLDVAARSKSWWPPGCKMALSLAMMALIEPGDEVPFSRSELSDLPVVYTRTGRHGGCLWAGRGKQFPT